MGNPVKNLWFGEIFSFFFCLLYFVMHIPHLTINHHNTQITIFISKWVFVWNNIDVTEFLEEFKLVFYVLTLFLLNFEHFYFFDNIELFLFFMTAEENVSRGTKIIRDKYPVPMSLPISYKSMQKILIYKLNIWISKVIN